MEISKNIKNHEKYEKPENALIFEIVDFGKIIKENHVLASLMCFLVFFYMGMSLGICQCFDFSKGFFKEITKKILFARIAPSLLKKAK